MSSYLKRLCLSGLLTTIAFITMMGVAEAQVAAPQYEGTRQAVGLFMNACIRLRGVPAVVRAFMNGRHVPELSPEARAIILRDHKGVGFDASNKVTRLALVSEDNGVCSAFAETADIAQVGPLFESTVKNAGFQLVRNGGSEKGSLITRFYKFSIEDHDFNVVISIGSDPRATFHAIFTLAPAPAREVR